MSTRYIVHKDDETFGVSIARTATGYRLEIEGETVQVDCRGVDESSVRSILIDGASYETSIMSSRDGVDVYVSGDVFHVRVTDELWARAQAAAPDHRGGEEIVSPMPGAVVRIAVAVGDTVAPGQTVAVVEAMKMQNEIAAILGGRVSEIRAGDGDIVEPGSVLVVLAPPGEAP